LKNEEARMNDRAKIVVVNPGEGDAYSALGDVYRVLASGDQTGGAYSLSEIRISPGNGPPPHVHSRDDEAFFVLEGEVTFQIGNERSVGRAGTFVQGPRGIPHSFRNHTRSAARMLVWVMPSGFENFVREFARRVPSFDSPALPLGQDEIAKLIAMAPKYGIEILPPPS
jgi:quercetin dioxygenase-like cupin family protein